MTRAQHNVKSSPRAIEKTVSNFGFVRVAAAVPSLTVGNVTQNVKTLIAFATEAAKSDTQIVVFPELSITGYTAADLFHQEILLRKAKDALGTVQTFSKKTPGIFIVGLPLLVDGKLFNVASVVSHGTIWGFVPKTYIPGYKEFYEERWFSSAHDLTTREIKINGAIIPIGADLLFRLSGIENAILGIEICEDLWTPNPPSSFQSLRGATIVANLSASNELIGKAEYRRQLVVQQSARAICGYVYASCGVHESTTDVVFSGHALIAENGVLLNETKRFVRDGEMVISDIDTLNLSADRMRITSFAESARTSSVCDGRIIDISTKSALVKSLLRHVDRNPFVPKAAEERKKRSEEIFAIQTAGLARRLEHARIDRVVIGVSGGLDSTLALLVAARTCDLLSLPRKNIIAVTMPGFATTKRTKSNAVKLAQSLGVTLETVDITKGTRQHLADIGHDGKNQDVTFENTQARYRTMILMNKANQKRAVVIGTGDLSEIALGWNTFNGDHISHYNVNAGIPKTLIRYLIEWVKDQKEFKNAEETLHDILETPISPELTRTHSSAITQKTEEIIGPYELHDFFLYHFVRWGSRPKKILFLAEQAFRDTYNRQTIQKWLKVFLSRFFENQWKRSVMPDGPKVGSVSLSPRGDWRMPSDADAQLWLKDL